ncbi:formyltetrahydrofolate deformylase [Robertkochia solimangrovi]|uniref:formyltetrahydrofolate deformylase n=1 Tax=Robertkochia solimangrovi TaxID=2213046 RepID=UPI00117C9EA3|nr:formyltetrahydrofolate deformylase [Robertkochia solimangrovi]TRZ43740.1 formyltetrahydrofolate deformylase [Robertkochia solimangrovi]
MNSITLLIHCPDSKGIIAGVTGFILKHSGNIVYNDQFVDRENGVFFMRTEAEFGDDFNSEVFRADFSKTLAIPYEMHWQCHTREDKPRMAVFVSKYDHCLYDILSRYHSGEWNVEIPLIISNHPDLEKAALNFDIPYYYIPVNASNKKEAEARQLELLRAFRIDFIVLARYMQIVSEKLIEEFPNRIINIHHSFLPAFVGAKPYHSAFKRGVKIIGATSHYVTEDLDAGPIIEQDVTRVTHAHSVKDLVSKGKDLEKIVLSRGIRLHIERKTMVFNNKTIIFS